jgi:gliding motility-associated-like protein
LDVGSGFQPLVGEVQPTLLASMEGMYRVQVGLPNGSQIISDVQVGFSPSAITYPVSDLEACGINTLVDLQEKDSEALGPQDPDQFHVSYHSSLAEAQAGSNPLPKLLTLAEGSQTIFVRTTSLGNPECYDAMIQFQATATAEPLLAFPEEVFICSQGGSAILGLEEPESGVQYRWDSGETTSSITVQSPGAYTLTATRSVSGFDCETIRVVEVVASATPAIDRVEVSDLQRENRIEIIPVSEGNFEYALNDGPYQSNAVFNGVAPGNYTVYMRDTLGCGEISEEITVVGFPLFFTPNGDGSNDRWEVFGMEQLTDPVLLIFDRYGKLLQQLDTNSPGWDGSYNGRLLPAADYWFRLEYTDASDQRQTARFLNAHFSLKR